MLFDASKIDEEKIIFRVLENISGDNDDIYLIHKPGTNAFLLRREDGTQRKSATRTKTIFNELKTDPKGILFLIDELDTKLINELKRSPYTKDTQLLKLIDYLENNIKK